MSIISKLMRTVLTIRFWLRAAVRPRTASVSRKTVARPVWKGSPRTFVDSSSAHPPILMMPGTMAYRMASTTSMPEAKAMSAPHTFAVLAFL